VSGAGARSRNPERSSRRISFSAAFGDGMARPERFELPTFWFVVGIWTQRQASTANNYQENQHSRGAVLGRFRLLLAVVNGQKADRREYIRARFQHRSFAGKATVRTGGLFMRDRRGWSAK